MNPNRRTFLSTSIAAVLAGGSAGAASPRERLPAGARISVASVGLLTNNADALSGWYRQVIGLNEIYREPGHIIMGAGSVPLLDLAEERLLQPDDPSHAGLYHTAFLLPSRADLASWLWHTVSKGYALDGASDHLVSEAVYLTDPEGNGVEVYADRPPENWVWNNGSVKMVSRQFDFDNLVTTSLDTSRPWKSAPDETVIGHVHLRVGQAGEASEWWQSELGFDEVRAREGAAFLSTDGYHHHVAANNWQSRGAKKRPSGMTGLSFLELADEKAGTAMTLKDPWDLEIRVSPKQK